MTRETSKRYNPNGNGFIILHRKILSSPIFENPNDLKIWIWCLLRSNHSNTSVFFGDEEIPVKRGQFIFGRFTGSMECNMHPSTFYKILKKLEKAGMISIKSNNKKSLLTVINYEVYQSNATPKEQQSNNKVTTEEQQSNTDNNDNNVNKENNRAYTASKSQPSDVSQVIAYGTEISLQQSECEKFFDYYTANGWRVGKNPMKDWKSAVRNWKRNNNKYNGANNAGTFNSNRQSDATRRATFTHGPEQIQRLRELEESLERRVRERGERV